MACDVDIAIIGAGVIGLAIASQVSGKGREVYILEKNESFGRETSSRNSGTIHTGILSPRGSLNTRLCSEGNIIIYPFCYKYGIESRRTGKLLVACDDNEIAVLEALYQRRDEGIEMQRLSRQEMRKLEPEVEGLDAILFPAAGVVDIYGLMRCYLGLARSKGAQLVCKSEVIGIEKASEGFRILIRDDEGVSELQSRTVINSAGLNSHKIAAMAGLDIIKLGYNLHYFKGEYYTICSDKARRMNRRLVYPMLSSSGLVGIHTVLDIDGRVRLGPDFYPVEAIDYSIYDSRRPVFLDGVKKLFPFVKSEDIDPESSGIMPRLYSREEKFKEFIIVHEQDKGVSGLIDLVGIESPGLTSSLAIANYVSDLVNDILN